MSNQELVEKREAVAVQEPKAVHEVQPVADILENDGQYEIVAEVPGARREDVSLRIENDTLHLSAMGGGGHAAVKRPFSQIRYVRSFRLGRQIDQESIHAELTHGVLKVTLAKVQQAQPRSIDVRIGEGSHN